MLSDLRDKREAERKKKQKEEEAEEIAEEPDEITGIVAEISEEMEEPEMTTPVDELLWNDPVFRDKVHRLSFPEVDVLQALKGKPDVKWTRHLIESAAHRKPRARRMALMVASVPELTIRTRSIPGRHSQIFFASSVSSSVGVPKLRPFSAACLCVGS